MAKKVGIITFHRAINYGAVLQTYGLWATLKNLGADVEIIDYHNEAIEKSYRLTWGLRKTYAGLKDWTPTIPLRQHKTQVFREFLSNEMTFTEPCTAEDIAQKTAHLDVVITGSDQVFNPKIFGNDPAYFCDFAGEGIKRYSYAASLGNYQFDPEKDLDFINALNSFECISVREASSVEQVDSLTDVPVRVDADPTLMLDRSSWNSLLPTERIREKPYLFLYSVHPFRSGLDQAKELAQATGYDVVYLHNRVRNAKKVDDDGVILLHASSPYEWLHHIRDAECVITNSFHGTALSILFNTPFLSEVNTGGGFNNRIWNLLSATGLTTRVVEKYTLDSHPIAESGYAEVDWTGAHTYLTECRQNSLQYLGSICE